MKIALLGLGSMNGAILTGFQQTGIPAENLVATCNSQTSAEKAQQKYGITVYSSAQDADANSKAVAEADVVLIGVKPAQVAELLASVAPHLAPNTIIVSVAAAVTLEQMAKVLPAGQPIIRTMPNTPTQVGAGVIGICAAETTSADAVEKVQDLLGAAATTVVIPEADMDALTGVSGSGPAYVFHFAEALIAAGVSAGLDEQTSRKLALGTIEGAAKMLAQPDADPAAMRVAVTSPNGTTAAALEKLQPLSAMVEEAVVASRDRATEISRSLD